MIPSSYAHPMSAFLTAAQAALVEMGVCTDVARANTEQDWAERFRETAYAAGDMPGSRRVSLHDGTNFRVVWSRHELRRFHDAVPAALWRTEDLAPADRWIERTFDGGNPEIAVQQLLLTISNAVLSSGLRIFPSDADTVDSITDALAECRYARSLARAFAELVLHRLDPVTAGHDAVNLLKDWSASHEVHDLILPIMTVFIERGLFSLSYETLKDRVGTLPYYFPDFPAGKIYATLNRILGDSRREQACLRLMATALRFGSCPDTALEGLLASFEEHREAIWALLERYGAGPAATQAGMKNVGYGLVTALERCPPGSAGDVIAYVQSLIPALGADFLLEPYLPPAGLDAALFSRCLRHLSAVAAVAAFDEPAFQREMRAAAEELQAWHAGNVLETMLDAAQRGAALTRARVEAAEEKI